MIANRDRPQSHVRCPPRPGTDDPPCRLPRHTRGDGPVGGLAPRRRREIPRVIRWTNNLALVVVDTVILRLTLPDPRGRACRHGRGTGLGPLQCDRRAPLGRRHRLDAAARPRDLPPARDVPRGAGAVAAAPDAPRRPRLRRRPPACASIRSRSCSRWGSSWRWSRRSGAPAVAVLVFEVLLNATAHVQPRQHAPAAPDRPRAAMDRRDARHAPRPPFGRSARDQQQLRLQPALVGPAARHLRRPARQAATRGWTIGIEQFRTRRDLWLDRMLVQPLRGPASGHALDPRITTRKPAE